MTDVSQVGCDFDLDDPDTYLQWLDATGKTMNGWTSRSASVSSLWRFAATARAWLSTGWNLRAWPKAMSLDECERIEFNLYSCFEYMRIGLEKNVMIVILRHRYRFISFWLSLLSLSS